VLFNFLLALVTVPAAEGMAATDKGERAFELLTEFCLKEETVSEKADRLVRAGWSNRASSGSTLFEGEGGLEAFGSDAFPDMVILLTSPASNREQVVNCIVDGKDIDVRDLIRVGYKAFGRPEQRGSLAIWPFPQLDQSIIAAPSRAFFHENKDAAFRLLVRFGPPSEVGDLN